jgi:hypothetical protein
MQTSIAPDTTATVAALRKVHKRNDTILFVVIFFAVFSLTPLLIMSGMSIGFGLLLGVLAALTVAVLAVRWPVAGFFVAAGSAVLIEEGSLRLGPVLTDQLYVFNWPPFLQGLPDRPIGFLFVFILLALVFHRLLKRQQLLQGGALLLPFLLYMLCVAGGVVHGLTSGGNFRIIVIEVRPFWYLFISYLLAYNLVTRIEHIKAFFWIAILGAGVKGAQGVYLFISVLHGSLRGHDELMAHEDSFFFAALLLLIILFCLHYRYRQQLYAALFVSPFVLVAMVANQRRADYVALLAGIVVVWLLVFLIKRHARKRLAAIYLISVALGAVYVAAFAHSTGSFASPAHSIVAIFNPDYSDTRDIASNLYRIAENYDLKTTEKQDLLFGVGFGKQFLTPYPLADVSAGDPYYLFIPHNTIYWVWMRLGPIGYLVLWYLFGAIIVRGCLIARQLRNPYLQIVAIYIVAVTFMEIIVAFADYQLFFYRNVIFLGLLAGILMKLPLLDEDKERTSK